VRTKALRISNLTTYKWQLQLLRRVSVFHDELAESLPNAMTNSVFGSFVVIVIREIELVLGMRIQPVTPPEPECLGCQRNQHKSRRHACGTQRAWQSFFWCLLLIEFQGSEISEGGTWAPNDTLGPGTRFENLVRRICQAPVSRNGFT
jgi:hypothetical protein